MNRRRSPAHVMCEIEAADATANDLTYTEIVAKNYTFTLKQLRMIAKSDLMKEHRRKAFLVTKELIKKHMYDLFNSHGGTFRFITNGYGQFKCVEHNNIRLSASEVFDKLDKIIA